VAWAAQILANHAQADGAAVATAYRSFINEMLAHQSTPELEPFVTHFYKVTMSYWRGLFWCYDVADLPRTNNDLEQYFGSARYLERRATGRKRPTGAMVVRGDLDTCHETRRRHHRFRVIPKPIRYTRGTVA
jgi:hypothetical protein